MIITGKDAANIFLLALIAGAVVFLLYHYPRLVSRADALEKAVEDERAAREDLEQRYSALDEALARREQQHNGIRQRVHAAEQQLKELQRDDPEVAEWSDQCVPHRLRGMPAPDPTCTGSPPARRRTGRHD